MSDRKRHGLVLLLVAGLIAASIVVLATKATSLGLDLKGGVQLVYQAEGTPAHPKVTTAELNNAVSIMEQRVDSLGVAQPEIQTSGNNEISVALPNVHNVKNAENEVGTTARLYFYDWEANALLPSGKTVASQLLTQNPRAIQISQGSTAASTAPGGQGGGGYTLYAAVKLASTQKPVANAKGVKLSRLGSEYFAFGAPGSAACKTIASRSGVKPIAGEHCFIGGGQAVSSRSDLAGSLKDGIKITDPGVEVLAVPQGTLVLEATPSTAGQQIPFGSSDTEYYVLRDRPALTGSEITNPEASTDSGGQPDVQFGFNSAGAKAFQDTTAAIAHRGATVSLGSTSYQQHFATALDNQILTVPSIDYKQYPDGIVNTGGSAGAEISGSFTSSTASQLANELRLGALPVNLKRISEQQVSATLGKEALHDGLIAGGIGFLVVILFLLLYYRLLGLIATTTLIVYALYFYALIKIIPVTMTLAGIAGLILTIGVAADANIVIFERVKEEIRAGRSVRTGIATGYKKGLTAIIDANVVTIITAFILFVLATQEVQGFALTLGVGTIVSLFTAVLATQAILMSAGDSKTLARPSALGAGKPKRRLTFDFMGASRYFFTMSGLILLIGALAVGGRGLKLGIDFTSGTQIDTTLQHTATVAQVQTITDKYASGATIEKVGDGNTFEISFKGGPKIEAEVRNALTQKYGTTNTNVTTVGPTFGSSVAHSAIIAIIASLLVISAYVALRFEWKFAVPTLIALAHDILITAGVYALTGRQVTVDTVAALLTILGFSLYDTIIVFDRVRENIPRMPRAAFSQIVNRSMSEVITRSLATTTCTLLPILALVLFGGAQLQDFAFALLIGVASGAYSSIFIASPVLTHWKEREPAYRHRRARIAADNGGVVPAYAVGNTDRDPAERRRRLSRLTDEPGQVSAEEFEQLKRDIAEDEQENGRGRSSTLTRRTARTDEDEIGEEESVDAPPPSARAQRSRDEAPEGPSRPTPQTRKYGGAGGIGTGGGGTRARRARAARQPGAQDTAAGAPQGGQGAGPESAPTHDVTPRENPDAPFEHAPDAVENEGIVPDTGQNPGQTPKGRNRRRHGRK
jgi:SecD/SecF fusion protein